MPSATISWVNDSVKIIDQTKLPIKVSYLRCRNVRVLWKAIRNLSVRGAPALGVAAAFGVLLGIKEYRGNDRKKFEKQLEKICRYIASARPTAVNLFHALDRMKNVVKKNSRGEVPDLRKLLKQEAMAMYEEDRRACRKIGEFGERLIKNGFNIMTICNAGALATVDYGTALGVMYSAKSKGKKFKVYSCETRPLLQGARLTAWELMREKIDTTLICDNMAATLMKQNRIQAVFTGADRIVSNGDTANKIGTYNLAVLSQYHAVPFYVVAPLSTFDRKIKEGKFIPIEERSGDEIGQIAKNRIAPRGVKFYNPAFDVTDNHLITAFVTECGVIYPPFEKNIKKIFNQNASKEK